MIAAFAIWNGRIAPVFDVARRVYLVQCEGDRISQENEVQFQAESAAQIALRLMESHVDVLICGAISQFLQTMVMAYGIEVIPFVAGELHQVKEAWLHGGLLKRNSFTMPGCGWGMRRHSQGIYPNQEEAVMFGRGSRRGAGSGAGSGVGNRSLGGRGRMGGPQAAGPAGECICPACGHREAHVRGVPCTQKLCPKCGTAMTRA
jgi:predicted Fe-Mo cluster-binding NifX family protein